MPGNGAPRLPSLPRTQALLGHELPEALLLDYARAATLMLLPLSSADQCPPTSSFDWKQSFSVPAPKQELGCQETACSLVRHWIVPLRTN